MDSRTTFTCTCHTHCTGFNDEISYTTWVRHAVHRQKDADFPGWWEYQEVNTLGAMHGYARGGGQDGLEGHEGDALEQAEMDVNQQNGPEGLEVRLPSEMLLVTCTYPAMEHWQAIGRAPDAPHLHNSMAGMGGDRPDRGSIGDYQRRGGPSPSPSRSSSSGESSRRSSPGRHHGAQRSPSRSRSRSRSPPHARSRSPPRSRSPLRRDTRSPSPEIGIDDLPLPTLDELKIAMEFVHLLREATHENSDLPEAVLEQLYTPLREAFDLDDPDHLQSVRLFLAADSREGYCSFPTYCSSRVTPCMPSRAMSA
jgi:hypothetical protein